MGRDSRSVVTQPASVAPCEGARVPRAYRIVAYTRSFARSSIRSVFAGLFIAALSLFPPATPDHALNTTPIRAPQVIVDAIGSSRKRRDEIEEAGHEAQSQEASPEGLTAHHRDATDDRCKWVFPVTSGRARRFCRSRPARLFVRRIQASTVRRSPRTSRCGSARKGGPARVPARSR
jgi:hypothetical protein